MKDSWTKVDENKFSDEVQSHMNYAKKELTKVLDKVLGEVYVDVLPWAYSDSLNNFRNAIIEDLISKSPLFLGSRQSEILQKIWDANKTEIVGLLNDDLLAENKRLQRSNDVALGAGTDYWRKFK